MDPSVNSSLDASSTKVPVTKVSVANASSLNVPSANTGAPNVKKHIIRRITHLDIQKLQQAGLDRKIAEALSKHKSEQKNKVKKSTDELKPSLNTKDISFDVSKPSSINESAAAKKLENTFKGKPPPKITITGPDALSEIEKQKLASLDPHQRLLHVKNLLNKKILQKGDTEVTDKTNKYKNLKLPPSCTENPHDKLFKTQSQQNPASKRYYCVLKDPPEEILESTNRSKKDNSPTKPKREVTATTNLDSTYALINVKPIKTKTSQKSPQDIARKLDFQRETTCESAHPVKQQHTKCLNKHVREVPKTLVKSAETHEQYKAENATQTERLKQSYYVLNTTTKGTSFQTEYIKQQKDAYKNPIPKASIKTSFSKQQNKSETKLDFPQVSPLKVSFPTVNVAKETPLPAIDSFKKPFSMGSTAYYDIQQKPEDKSDFIPTNYDTSFNVQPATSLTISNLVNNASKTSTLTGSLIVLENKILSQDEMIDLTELRLPTTTPRFINPHRPIPELVIKQEKTDEYTETVNSTLVGTVKPKQLQTQNNDKVSTAKLRICNKGNKRIIINAQKLKFTPEQLAEVAKKMKEKTSASVPVTKEINQHNEVRNVCTLSTTAANAQLSSNTMTYVAEHNTENIAQTKKEISNKFIIKNNTIYDYIEDQNVKSTSGVTDHVVNATSTEPANHSYFHYSNYESQKNLNNTISESTKYDNISAIEIVEEPIENEDCFSAVDFILALGNTNTLTAEKSLELSPEELNLNASCAINLSPICKEECNTPSLKALSSQKTSTPKLSPAERNNVLKSHKESAVVIENSKSSQASLTNDSSIKSVNDQNNFNKLQTFTTTNLIESKLDLVDRDFETSLVSSVREMSTEKSEHVLKNKTTDEKKQSSTVFIDNLNFDSNSHEVKTFEASLKYNTSDTVLETTANEMSSSNKNETKLSPENNNSVKKQMKSNVVIESSTSFPGVLANDSSNDQNNFNELETATTADLTKSKLHLVDMDTEVSILTSVTEDNTKKLEHVLENKETVEKKHCLTEFIENFNADCNSHKVNTFEASLKCNTTDTDLKTKTAKPVNEMSPSSKDITKLPQEIASSKTNAIRSNTTVATTRISRFKKGKINLVQRHKTGQILNKPLTEDNNIVVNKSALNKESENKVAETQDELHKQTEKNFIELYNDMFTKPKQSNETPEKAESIKSSKEKEGSLEETKFGETRSFHPIEITDNKLLTPRSIALTKMVDSLVINNLAEPRDSILEKEMTSQDKNPQTSVLFKDIQTRYMISPNMSQHHTNNSEITTTMIAELSNTNEDDLSITHEKRLKSYETPRFKTEESLADNLNQQSKTTLEAMKIAKISLIDVAKHSPTKYSSQSCPLKKTCGASNERSPEVKDIKSLLNKLNDSNKDSESEQPIAEKGGQESLSEVVDQKVETNSCSRRSASRHSTRPLISDDDLEFLPENVEIKFELSKSKQNEKNKACNKKKIDSLIEKHDRRQSLYSKPHELELFNTSSSSRTKRNRYFSQTLETNVTVTFDTLKSKQSLRKCIKPLEIEESCDTSTTQESCPIQPSKQYKNMRKTTVDIKETENAHSIIDYDNGNPNCDCVMRDCEESNEFLGFEDNSENSNIKNAQYDTKETDHTTKTKHGTLKNWLTTGKAISPTLGEQRRKRLRYDDERTELSSASHVACTDRKKNFLKNRCSPCYDETDITDDTSPADDDDEINEVISVRKKCKRGIKNVIDSNKALIDNKKIKLDDSMTNVSFAKPHSAKLKNSVIDLDCHNKKPEISRKSLLSIKKSQKGEPNVKKLKKISCSESDMYEKRLQVNNEKAVINSNWKECHESRHEKLKDEVGNVKKTNDSSDKVVLKTDTNIDKSDSKSKRGKKLIKMKHRNKADNIEVSDKDAKKYKKINRSGSDSHEEPFQVNTEKPDSNKNFQECDESTHHKLKDEVGNIEKSNDSSEGNKTTAVMERDINTDKSSTDSQRRRKSKNIKRGNKAEDIDNNLSVKSPKTKRRFHVKSVNDEEENLLQILQQPDIATKHLYNKNKIASARLDDTDAPEESEKFDSENCNVVKAEQEISVITNENVATKRKRGRPKKVVLFDSSEDKVLSTSVPLTTPRGKKSKQNLESNFNSRLLLITKREQLDTDEILTETEPASGSIQCGLCLKCTHEANWLIHLSEHYGVGWKVGEEKLHIENRNAVLNNIMRYMKVAGCNEIKCRMCKKVYRSALGILSHIESCGAEIIRVMCEFCEREYVQNSIAAHLRSCYARNRAQNQSCDENPDDTNGEKEKIVSNSGRLKRHSTIKAENKLKELGEELEKDDVKSVGDPKLRIGYVEPKAESFSAKWSKDIKELGKASCPKSRCKFTSNDINELSRHLKECKFIKSGYICNFCRRVFPNEKEAIAHVIKRHQNRGGEPNDSDCDLKTADENSSDDDLSEGVDENELTDDVAVADVEYIKTNDKKVCKKQISRKAVFDGRHADLDKEVLRKWKDFLKSNYTCELLYSEFTSNYSIINHEKFNKYLPTETVSMKYSFGNKNTLISTVGVPQKNIEWREMKKYESSSNKMNTYFFLGAPVKLCTWLPLPSYVNEQYLAVVYRVDMFQFIKFTNPKKHPSVVLILKVTQNKQVPELNIHYGFVVNDGPIHHLSFLPSGGYDEASNRLGLVAVATVTSCINIYSLPINVELSSTQDKCSRKNNITLIDVKPSFVLNLDMFYQKDAQPQHILLNTQCLQVYWSEYLNHQHIFAGFSNGFIGIWEIVNDPQQNLNHFVVENVINYAPLNYFYIGEKCAKFAVHYDTSGPRWLAVSSAYRKLIIYDIKNLSQPIIMKEDFHKNLSLDLEWSPVWETVIYSYCDSLQSYGRSLTAVNPNNIMFPHNRVDVMSCGITQVHYTPVINVCVTAMSNGDIIFLHTRELHYECPLDKKFGERRLLYGMDVKQLNGEPLLRLGKGIKNDDIPSGWIMNDVDYKEKYGLIFEPLLKIKENHRKNYVDDNRAPPVNIIPFMRINTLRCNINEKGKDLIAVGYENGFLRLVNFNTKFFVSNK